MTTRCASNNFVRNFRKLQNILNASFERFTYYCSTIGNLRILQAKLLLAFFSGAVLEPSNFYILIKEGIVCLNFAQHLMQIL